MVAKAHRYTEYFQGIVLPPNAGGTSLSRLVLRASVYHFDAACACGNDKALCHTAGIPVSQD